MEIKPDQELLLEGIRKKRLLFTVTTGRSGTYTLKQCLSRTAQSAVYHEPHPQFHWYLRGAQQTSEVATQFWLQQKLPKIYSHPAPVYIETSHLICKGFLEQLWALDIFPELIFLIRPKRAVAQSLWQLNTIPGRSAMGLSYYLAPFDPGVLAVKDWKTLSDYQLCYWYTLEMERRSEAYRTWAIQHHIPHYTIPFKELVLPDHWPSIWQQLGLEEDRRKRLYLKLKYWMVSRQNQKDQEKQSIPNDPAFYDEQEKELLTKLMIQKPIEE